MPRRQNKTQLRQRSLSGRLILIVQPWQFAKLLAAAFEAQGAHTLTTKDANTALPLADLPDLSAAVLDSNSDALGAKLAQRNIPFVLYSGRQEVTGNCAPAPLIRKPAPANEVVATVEQLLL